MLPGLDSPGPPQPGGHGLRPEAVDVGPSVNGAATAGDDDAASAMTAPAARTALRMERPPSGSTASVPGYGRRSLPRDRRPGPADTTPVAGLAASERYSGRRPRVARARAARAQLGR